MTNMGKRDTVRQYNVAQAKAQFSELVKRAMAGEAVVIARDNKPVLALVPLADPTARRVPGSAGGRVWMAPDFDAPLEDFGDYT